MASCSVTTAAAAQASTAGMSACARVVRADVKADREHEVDHQADRRGDTRERPPQADDETRRGKKQ